MSLNFKDLRVGLLFVAIGLAFGVHAYLNLRLGTPARMGPGFFPLALSVVLVVLGALICAQAWLTAPSPVTLPSWRALAFVLTAPVIFGLTLDGLGFVLTIAIVALVAALANRGTGLVRALMISAGLTAMCVAIFIVGLKLPLRLVGTWLGG